MSRKVLIASPMFSRISPAPMDVLLSAGMEVLDTRDLAPYSEDWLVEKVETVGGVILGTDSFTTRVIDAAPELRIIARHGVGYDNVDVQAATRRGVMVTNTPATNTDAVADLAVGLMLASARRIPYASQLTKAGEWPKVTGRELWSKTVGIVGLGQIGRGVARRVSGFNATILAHDILQDEDFAACNGIRYVNLEELLRRSDFVTLHVPLTEQTRRLISTPQLALMKPTAHLINTSRGPVVDERALAAALTEGRIAGAALDVFEMEPPRRPELLSLNNLVATPHLGALTAEALTNMGMVAAEEVVAALQGRQPRHVVNAEALLRGCA